MKRLMQFALISALHSTSYSFEKCAKPFQPAQPEGTDQASERAQPQSLPLEIPLEEGEAGKQADSWSCGPCGASKLINYYLNAENKKLITYEEVKGMPATEAMPQASLCPHFDIPNELPDSKVWADLCEANPILMLIAGFMPTMRQPLRDMGVEKIGPSPEMLAQHMNKFTAETSIEFVVKDLGANVDDLVALLAEAKPVLLVIKLEGEDKSLPAEFENFGVTGEIPQLHYILLNHYDVMTQTFSYIDTDNSQKNISRDKLQAQWNWDSTGTIKDFLTEQNMKSGLVIVGEKKVY